MTRGGNDGLLTYPVYFNPDYVASEYAFDTTRKAGELAARIMRGGSSANLVDPIEFVEQTERLIERAHAPDYVEAVKSGSPVGLAESQGFDWDPKIATMATAHSAGLVAAVTAVLSGPSRFAGSLSSGLHHARRGNGAGYCTFNGLAVAAGAALELGAERILILDLDAHCGGGTRSLTDPASVVQIDVSTVGFDIWSPAGPDALLMARPEGYLAKVAEALRLADTAGTFDLVLYNAGMDPANSGVSAGDLKTREHMVGEWARDREHHLAYALAGGYTGYDITMSDLVELHLLTVEAFG
jgi:acetoin utilization deacetylase AcuC-like enzyme